MSMMFTKWRHRTSTTTESSTLVVGSSGGIGGVEKDGDGDHRSYRTHLIFAGKRDPEGPSGQNSVTQTGSLGYYGTQSASLSFSSHSNHPFAQAQNIRPHHHGGDPPGRRKSTRPPDEELLYRPGIKQVSFGGGGGVNGWPALSSGQNQQHHHQQQQPHSPTTNNQTVPYGSSSMEESGKPQMLEVVAGLSRDCFIIPLACVDRFLPAGLTLPELKSKSNSNGAGAPLNILEVADPQLAVVVHLMTPLISLNPPLESPLSQPERIQRALALQLLQKASAERQASHGLLLASMESGSDFPLMALYVVPKLRADASDFLETSRKNALDIFDPSSLGYCGDHFFHLCREVATIARPPMENPAKKGKSAATGYIVSIFRVFDGDDREKLERNWLYWTGARTLYRHLPKSVGLRRITLHKSAAVRGDKLYLLLCECANFLENVNSAAQLLPSLRARLCGYTGIYRVAGTF